MAAGGLSGGIGPGEAQRPVTKTPPNDARPASFLWHPAGAVAARLGVGTVLVYAGLHKMGHAGELARIVYAYRLVHLEMVNLVAMILPWLEMLAGILLVLGLLRRSSALVACALFGLFAAAVGLALFRGIDVLCGCFSLVPGGERIGWGVLLRDGALAVVSACLIAHPSDVAALDAFGSRPG